MTKGRQSVGRETPREFFIQIPAFLEYLSDLDPFAWRLYAHYLRVCGEVDSCYEYTATTSRLCNMSERTIRYRRQVLADLNLISFWYEGRRGDERVNVIIRDVWGVNAKFLQLLRTKSVGEWIEPWIREEMAKIGPIGEDALSEGKQPPASGAARPASETAPPAPKTAPPASDADIERSINKIPDKDPLDSVEGDHSPIGNSDPSPTPQPAPAPAADALIAAAEKVAEAETFDGPKPAANGATKHRQPATPVPSSPHYDGRKFKNGYIPAGKGTTAVEVYYEAFSIRDNDARLTEPNEEDLINLCPDLDRLRTAVTAYRRSGNYRKGNLQLVLDWYNGGVPSHKPTTYANGHSKPAVNPDIKLKDWLLRTYNGNHLPTVISMTGKAETELRNEFKQWRIANGLPPG